VIFLVLSALPVGLFSYSIGAQEAVRAVSGQTWLCRLGLMGLGLVGGALTAAFCREMAEARNELEVLNEHLEEKVQERTAALRAETVARRQIEERFQLIVEGIKDRAILMLDT
jgi:hypothetical protein